MPGLGLGCGERDGGRNGLMREVAFMMRLHTRCDYRHLSRVPCRHVSLVVSLCAECRVMSRATAPTRRTLHTPHLCPPSPSPSLSPFPSASLCCACGRRVAEAILVAGVAISGEWQGSWAHALRPCKAQLDGRCAMPCKALQGISHKRMCGTLK